MNLEILKAIENSSHSEIDLSKIDEVIRADDIRLIAKCRPDLESLTLETPDDEALTCLFLFSKIKKLFINQTMLLSREGEWVESISALTQLTHLTIKRFEDIDERFLRKLCRLRHLVSINFEGSYRICDETVYFFSEFKQLRFLNITNSDYLEDSDMPHLTSLIHLEGLEMAYTCLTDKGYQSLSTLVNLKYLDLSGTKVSDESLKLFSTSLHNLELLNLSNCHNITGQGLAYLKNLLNLHLIYVDNYPKLTNFATKETLEEVYARSTDEAYQPLSALVNLKYLDLSGTKVSDEDLRSFSLSFHDLELLNLSNCQNITDEGFLYLKELPYLRSVYIANCSQITEDAIQQFSPEVKITQTTNLVSWKCWDLHIKNINNNTI